MTDSNETKQTKNETPKMSFKDAVKQQLEAKKAKQTGSTSKSGAIQQTQKMKSQQSKKVNNSHRKMGI